MFLCLHQVPPTRRYSHDETDMWTTGPISSYLHRWGSTEDMMGVPRYTSNRHERRRSSLASCHEESSRHQRVRRSSDGTRSLPRPQRSEDNLGCFSRDEVINFIDETPLASPIRSPRRVSALSLVTGTERQIILLPHFPLTHFEREPQALRCTSEHRGSCTELYQGSPRKNSINRGGSECVSDKGCREQRRHGKRASELILTGQSAWTASHSSLRAKSGQGEGHVTKSEIQGSMNSYRNSQSPSSRYTALHSGSIA